MSSNPEPIRLSPAIEHRLGALLRRWRWYVVAEAAAAIVAAWGVGFALLVTADYYLRLGRTARGALLAPLLAALVYLVLRRLRPALRQPLDASDAAHLAERADPRLRSLLVSSVRFSRGQIGDAATNSPELARSVVSEANAALSSIDVSALLRHRRAAVASGILALSGMCLGIWAQICPASLGLALRRSFLLSVQEWPKRTRLVLDVDGDRIVAATGDDLEVRARVEGVVPRTVEVLFETAGGPRGRQTMTRVGDAEVRHTFVNLEQPLRFRLQGGDDRTREIEVVLSERPRVASASIRVAPPAYARLEEATLPANQRTIRALAGSRIDLELTTSKPVASAEWFADNQPLGILEGARDRWRARIDVSAGATYHVQLTDPEGLSSRRHERFVVRLIVDEAPTVRLLLSGVGERVTPQAVLPIRVEATDDFGLAGVRLDAVLADSPDAVTAPDLSPLTSGSKVYEATTEWSPTSAGVAPGDMLSLAAYATDLNDVTGPGEARSLPVTLRIVTREELQSDLARREQEARSEFQRLVDQQEELRRQLLTAADRLTPQSTPVQRAERLAPLERRQRSLAAGVAAVARQVERIVAEIRINAMNDLSIAERIESEVSLPLNQLAEARLPQAAERVRSWSADGTDASEGAVDPAQALVLNEMAEILTRMRRTEGYHDAVTMLQDIIRLQKELNEETREKAVREASDIFDD
ncbi:MAG: hypothetical protein FLDDKLPJ_00419 [Phycisphaerae bacterium]|nr:hypothetical protein [Phycisphaerae bacterium]